MAPKKISRKAQPEKKKCRNFKVQIGPQRFKWPNNFPLPRKLPAILTWEEQPTRVFDEVYNMSDKLDVNYANCLICRGIVREPVEMPCCPTWFCSLCFLQQVKKNPPRRMLARMAYEPLTQEPRPHFSTKCIKCQGLFCFLC